ncbi:hypothetical protein M5K25_006692 [Dendrobium thyrsiflorum]|uniref:Uncharacterized protein n=1 Tax=Dendrobium thyrsiflorum TaxID=117978 RepID=A0ABD0VD93_DENTH
MQLRELYSSIAKLRQLHHFLMGMFTKSRCYQYSVSTKVGVLRNFKKLQTLVGFEIDDMEKAMELGYLTQLRKLDINLYLESYELSSLCFSLDKISESLHSLSLSTDSLFGKPKILHMELKKSSFLAPKPSNSSLFLYLKQLDDLKVIKTLPNLRFLAILCLSPSMLELPFSTGGFQNLKLLELNSLIKLKSIEFKMECMLVLEKLAIIHCTELMHVIGIGVLPCLQEIQFKSVSKGIVDALNSEANKYNIHKLTAIDVKDNN